MKFKRGYTQINLWKIIILFILSIFLLVSLGGRDSLIEKTQFVLVGVFGCLLGTFVVEFEETSDWITIDENGITVIKFWDALLKNEKKTEYQWKDFSYIRVSGGGRAGTSIWLKNDNNKIRMDFSYEIFNFIRQYYPNIVVWIELDESKVKKNVVYPNYLNRDEIFFRLGHEKSEELLTKLRKVKNPNFQDDAGTSYLHIACQSHYVEAIKILLEIGADPNINDNRGFSPIMSAIGRINEHNNEILELMLQHGLNLDKMEGKITLKEKIESFNEEDMNYIMEKYYHK